ncbi:MAG: hypothetical protein OXQ29_10835 [Rhodospirillaceae bacterium]|nr:hypothetical protein [Rhodospirillaceae bacterium]
MPPFPSDIVSGDLIAPADAWICSPPAWKPRSLVRPLDLSPAELVVALLSAVMCSSESVASVRVEARPSRLLELVGDGFDLRGGRPVLWRPCDHGRAVLVLELERVGCLAACRSPSR